MVTAHSDRANATYVTGGVDSDIGYEHARGPHIYSRRTPSNKHTKMDKTPLSEIIGAPTEKAKQGNINEDAMEEFYGLPDVLLARLIRAIPPEAAAATKPKKVIVDKKPSVERPWRDGSWTPSQNNAPQTVNQDGDLHDCIYELFFFYLYGWVPQNHNLNRQHYLDELENYGTNESKELSKETTELNLIAVAWREHFKRELCSVLSFVLDPKSDIRKGTYGRGAQSEIALKEFRPRLISSANQNTRSKPSRYLCTPVALGGLRIDAIEVLDLIIYNLGKNTGWYHDNDDSKKKGRFLKPSERRTGRAEALITLVPQRGVIKTLSGLKHQYYSGPLHTLLRENERSVAHLIRFMNQTRHWWNPHKWNIQIQESSVYRFQQQESSSLFYPSVPGWEKSTSVDELLELLVGKRRAAKFKRCLESAITYYKKSLSVKGITIDMKDVKSTKDGNRIISPIQQLHKESRTCIYSRENESLKQIMNPKKMVPIPVILKKGVFYETVTFETPESAVEAVFPGYTHQSSY